MKSKTSRDVWSGKRPNITHMCVFGCIVYAKVLDAKKTIEDPKKVILDAKTQSVCSLVM